MRRLAVILLVLVGCAESNQAPPRLAMVPIRDEAPQQAAPLFDPGTPSTGTPTSLVPADLVPPVAIDTSAGDEVQLVEGIGRAEMPGGSIAGSFESGYVTRVPSGQILPAHVGFPPSHGSHGGHVRAGRGRR